MLVKDITGEVYKKKNDKNLFKRHSSRDKKS